MLSDRSYHFLRGLLDAFLWGGELTGEENLPERGPAVFVANHALALGPIAIVASVPLRLYPWVVGDMLDWQKAPAYLNKDFVEPQLHIPPPLSMAVARLLAQASVRLLRAIGSIPVWQGESLLETYRLSMEYLEQERYLLIFPEDPAQPLDEQCHMSPFKKGFARLGEMFFERTGKALRFYPLVVHPHLRQVNLGQPIVFNPKNLAVAERRRIKSALEATIRRIYVEMSLQGYHGVPLPR